MSSTLANVLARNVRTERLRLDLTQQELAHRLGWSLKTVQRIEAGDRRLYFDELPAICLAFGVDVWRLLLDAPDDEIDLMFPRRGR